ncbi:hypothetical protein I4F81_012725 [Pyropia yezoensis]|uniref:Uncharacterized protein n=1 Tax=Pyropia yezoensis TaxID=2788 RepID=A0ACC3CJG2_PYRYE|nr:hypothetical protein I4F81_012725 [Neopyropia yezoensis]
MCTETMLAASAGLPSVFPDGGASTTAPLRRWGAPPLPLVGLRTRAGTRSPLPERARRPPPCTHPKCSATRRMLETKTQSKHPVPHARVPKPQQLCPQPATPQPPARRPPLVPFPLERRGWSFFLRGGREIVCPLSPHSRRRRLLPPARDVETTASQISDFLRKSSRR